MNTREVDPRIREYVRLFEAGEKETAYAVMEELLAEREIESRAKVAANEAAHAAFHGRPLKYVTVERRRGYRGRSVCRDCYYGKEWR